VAIAYAGTLAVGRAAEFYYRTGLKPTRSQLDQFTRQAAELLREADIPARRRALTKNGEVSDGSAGAPPATLHDIQQSDDSDRANRP
jgi:hypothetical protein